MAEFRHFFRLARSLQHLLHGRRNGPDGRLKGEFEMTFNLNSLQHIAVSAIGAVFAATLFISAAVGPAGQFI
jgi:hypothetical protein